jgi:hypothetical protein
MKRLGLAASAGLMILAIGCTAPPADLPPHPGYGDYIRGTQVHRDFEAAARWCEAVSGLEPGEAPIDCVEEALFE